MTNNVNKWDQQEGEEQEAYEALKARLEGSEVGLTPEERVWRIKYAWDDRIAAFHNQKAKEAVEASESVHKRQLIEARDRRIADFKLLRENGRDLMDMAMQQLSMDATATTDPETGEILGVASGDTKGAVMMFNTGMAALKMAMDAEDQLLAISRLLKAQLKRSAGR